MNLLLGLSEGKAQVEISASFFHSVANRSQVINTYAPSYGHAYIQAHGLL